MPKRNFFCMFLLDLENIQFNSFLDILRELAQEEVKHLSVRYAKSRASTKGLQYYANVYCAIRSLTGRNTL